jgi:hypothetical protein
MSRGLNFLVSFNRLRERPDLFASARVLSDTLDCDHIHGIH